MSLCYENTQLKAELAVILWIILFFIQWILFKKMPWMEGDRSGNQLLSSVDTKWTSHVSDPMPMI